MKEDTNYIDIHVGQKIRLRRDQLRLSQAELGKVLGVSAQQVQRYEYGENTVSLNRLMQIAQALNVKPSYFYEDATIPTPSEANASAEVVSRGLTRPMRLLLIEDSPNDVILFQQAVVKHGLNVDVHHIQNPDKVMDFLNHHDTKYGKPYPDLIILDINMPRVNGLTLLKEIKESEHKKVPVVMLTNSIRAKEMLNSYELHASGFIQKSVELHQYYDDIQRIVLYWADMAVLPSTVH